MKKFIQKPRCLVLMVSLLLSGVALAGESASIPFANMGSSIRDWQPDGDEALYVQDIHKDWYRATLWAPCFDLPFVLGVGFVTGVTGKLDQFSSVIVERERCQFKTFEKSGAPPPREKRKKAKDKDVSVKSADQGPASEESSAVKDRD